MGVRLPLLSLSPLPSLPLSLFSLLSLYLSACVPACVPAGRPAEAERGRVQIGKLGDQYSEFIHTPQVPLSSNAPRP
eukprot:305862-Rhodomonas_salina.1